MKFLNITIKNFRSYGNETTFDLTKCNAITLISGNNGLGKSTIFEAVSYVLYGRTREEKIDDIINRQIQKNCKVAVEFSIGDDVFKCFRYRKHSTHNNNVYLFKNNEDISCKNVSDTNQLILDIIKISYIGFVNSTFFSSESYKPFLRSKNSDRLNIFESLLSLKEAALIYDSARKHSNETKEKLQEQQVVVDIINNEIKTFNSTIISYKQNAKDRLLSLKKRKEEILILKESYENGITELRALDIDKEKNIIREYLKKSEIEKNISILKSSIKEINEPTEDVLMEAASFEAYDWEKEIEAHNLKKFYEEKIQAIKTELDKLKNVIISIDKEIYNNEKDIELLLRDKKLIEEKINKFTDEDRFCSLCLQPITSQEAEKQKAYFKDHLDRINIELQGFDNEKLIKEKKQIELEVGKAEYKIKEFTNDSSKCECSFANPIETKSKYELAFKEVEYYDKEKNLIEENNNKLTDEIAVLVKQLKELVMPTYTEKEIANIDEEISNLVTSVAEINKELDSISGSVKTIYDKGYIEDIEKKIKEKEKSLEGEIEVLENIKDDNKHYLFLTECFSNKANSFKKYFIGEMIDTFNNKINQFLPFMFHNNISIEFDKDLNETINFDGQLINFSSLSSGQKSTVELAIAFYLFNLSRVFFSNDSDILVIDEILDQSVDYQGLKQALDILKGFSSDTKIFVISHNQDIKDLIENKIKVEMDENGFSKLIA